MDATDDFLNTYTFDNLGRMTRIEQEEQPGGNTVAEKRVDLAYLTDGRFDTITRYVDLAGTDLVATSTYGYDDAGRLTSLQHAKGANTLADYLWTYDAHRRITQFVSDDGTTDYTYDATHQLTDADHSYQTDESYEFDENGNRTSAGAAAYTVGTNNRLTGDGTHTYLYDDEGNRTRKTTNATGAYVEYAWDHRNRLTAVTFKTSGGTTTKKVEYDYDLFDRLITRRVDSDGDSTFDSAESFVYDAPPGKGGLSDVVLVFDDAGSLTHRYLHGPAVDQVFADEDALGEVLWSLGDNQNSVRDLVEYDAGTDTTSVVNHLEYDSFGNITVQSSPADQPQFAWTGRYRDPETGLQYNRARWYDTPTGLWLSMDPSGFAPDTNPYRYVHNAPTNQVDPSGLQPPVGTTGVAIATVAGEQMRRQFEEGQRRAVQEMHAEAARRRQDAHAAIPGLPPGEPTSHINNWFNHNVPLPEDFQDSYLRAYEARSQEIIDYYHARGLESRRLGNLQDYEQMRRNIMLQNERVIRIQRELARRAAIARTVARSTVIFNVYREIRDTIELLQRAAAANREWEEQLRREVDNSPFLPFPLPMPNPRYAGPT